MSTKRVVIAGDSHCGHFVGMTHPRWECCGSNEAMPMLKKYHKTRRQMWSWFVKAVAKVRPIDALLWLGDSIDGRGERSGSTELLVVDRNLQIAMAHDVLDEFHAEHVVMVRGTPYHTGQQEDFEDILAEQVHADKIGNHEWVEINGCCFDLKHKVGSSQIPHGRHTSVAREQLWNSMWAEADLQPRANVLARGHVHYCSINGRIVGTKVQWGMTAPALQGMGSKYGSKECSGLVHLGFVVCDIEEDGSTCPRPIIAPIKAQKATALKL